MIVEDYSEPEEFEDGTVLPGTGQVWGICTVGEHGEAEQTGAPGVCTCPLTWGSMDDDDYIAVSGWIVVSDLDGAQGTGVQGRLLAAYWGGRLWLQLATVNNVTGDNDSETDNVTGVGYIGEVGEFGELVETQGRAVRPQVLICPMTERDSYLKTPSGEWRGDLYWEVLANFCYSENGHVYDQDAAGVWVPAQCWRVTIWMVPVDGMLCFYATRSPYLTSDLRTYAPFANRLSRSAWGLPYEAAGYDLTGLNDNGGPWYGYYCALLPWEAEGAEPVSLEDGACVDAVGACGANGYVGDADDAPDTVPPAALHPGVQVCARDHYTGPWGLAYYNACYGVFWHENKRPTSNDLYGVDTWAEAVRQSLTGTSGVLVDRQPTQQFRFDAASIEGAGRMLGYTAGSVVPGDAVWPPNGPAYRMLTQSEITTPNGTLYLGIAGTETDGVLLTASMYAEPVTWADPESTADAPEIGGQLPDGDQPVQPDGDGAGGSGGGGGSGSGGDTGDPDAWPPAVGSLPDGIYLTGGSGVSVSAEQQIDRDSDGRVSNIRYSFTISAGNKQYSGNLNFSVAVQLTVSGGGSYTVWGNDETMYYGFSSETSSTVTWASSYIGGGGDPTTSTVSTTVSATARITINISDGTADSESAPTSNILSVNKSGGRRRTCVGGIERYFDIYTVSLNNDTLKTIAENAALNAAGSVQATLENSSVTGSNSGPPSPPTVSASVQGVTVSGSSGGDSSITGCMSGTISGLITPSGTGSISIAGSGSWLYDDDSGDGGDGGDGGEPTQSRATGSISGTITVKLQSKSF